MANQWFRMYSEFAHDTKVQMMTETMQRRFVMILCLRCSNVSATLHDEEIAFQLRISEEEWKATKSLFVSRNMLSEDNEVINWDKRQFCSDSSTERSRKHREQKKDMQQQCNVAATPPDTETDTEYKNTVGSEAELNLECSVDPECKEDYQEAPEEEKPKRNDYPQDFLTFFLAYPKTEGSKKKAYAAWKKARDKPNLEQLLSLIEKCKKSERWQRNIIPHPETWLNQARWETVEAEIPAIPEAFKPREFDPRTIYGDDFEYTKAATTKH